MVPQGIRLSLLAAGDLIVLAPQVLAEFIHVATDPRRFAQPLDLSAARQLAEQWWMAREVVQVFPDPAAIRQFFAWLHHFELGRKRLLDTLLAATYQQAGVQSLLTTNPGDFTIFGTFTEARDNDTLMGFVVSPICWTRAELNALNCCSARLLRQRIPGPIWKDEVSHHGAVQRHVGRLVPGCSRRKP
jgi:predicted nucleic acid-binding protein